MFSKEVIEGLMWNFHERFDSLSKRDKDIKESTEELLTLIGSNVTNLKKFRTNIEDAMSARWTTISYGVYSSGNFLILFAGDLRAVQIPI